LKKQYKINDGKLFVVLLKSNHCIFFLYFFLRSDEKIIYCFKKSFS